MLDPGKEIQERIDKVIKIHKEAVREWTELFADSFKIEDGDLKHIILHGHSRINHLIYLMNALQVRSCNSKHRVNYSLLLPQEIDKEERNCVERAFKYHEGEICLHCKKEIPPKEDNRPNKYMQEGFCSSECRQKGERSEASDSDVINFMFQLQNQNKL